VARLRHDIPLVKPCSQVRCAVCLSADPRAQWAQLWCRLTFGLQAAVGLSVPRAHRTAAVTTLPPSHDRPCRGVTFAGLV
jgi:hypothetical protein